MASAASRTKSKSTPPSSTRSVRQGTCASGPAWTVRRPALVRVRSAPKLRDQRVVGACATASKHQREGGIRPEQRGKAGAGVWLMCELVRHPGSTTVTAGVGVSACGHPLSLPVLERYHDLLQGGG
jgi:hypothetical protein